MTILLIQSVAECWTLSEKSSVPSFVQAGSAPHDVRIVGDVFGASYDEPPIVADALDELLQEAEESNPGGLANARKWVASTFYGGSETLAALRLRLGLSQQQLAERCGMKQSNISRYESGGARPTDRCARLLQEALQLEVLEDVYRAYDRSCADREDLAE